MLPRAPIFDLPSRGGPIARGLDQRRADALQRLEMEMGDQPCRLADWTVVVLCGPCNLGTASPACRRALPYRGLNSSALPPRHSYTGLEARNNKPHRRRDVGTDIHTTYPYGSVYGPGLTALRSQLLITALVGA